jgi:hypothetical protein
MTSALTLWRDEASREWKFDMLQGSCARKPKRDLGIRGLVAKFLLRCTTDLKLCNALPFVAQSTDSSLDPSMLCCPEMLRIRRMETSRRDFEA